jgi:phage terminase Nu1 subunit (DNA packaging protein)
MTQLFEMPDINREKLSVQKVSEIFGVSVTVIYEWLKTGIFDKEADGLILLVSAIRGVYLYQRRLIDGTGGDDLITQKVRSAKADAELKELELLERKGELISASEVKSAAFESGRRVRDAIGNVPSRISALLAAENDPMKVKELLTNELRQALEGLSNQSKALAERQNIQ